MSARYVCQLSEGSEDRQGPFRLATSSVCSCVDGQGTAVSDEHSSLPYPTGKRSRTTRLPTLDQEPKRTQVSFRVRAPCCRWYTQAQHHAGAHGPSSETNHLQ